MILYKSRNDLGISSLQSNNFVSSEEYVSILFITFNGIGFF